MTRCRGILSLTPGTRRRRYEIGWGPRRRAVGFPWLLPFSVIPRAPAPSCSSASSCQAEKCPWKGNPRYSSVWSPLVFPHLCRQRAVLSWRTRSPFTDVESRPYVIEIQGRSQTWFLIRGSFIKPVFIDVEVPVGYT